MNNTNTTPAPVMAQLAEFAANGGTLGISMLRDIMAAQGVAITLRCNWSHYNGTACRQATPSGRAWISCEDRHTGHCWDSEMVSVPVDRRDAAEAFNATRGPVYVCPPLEWGPKPETPRARSLSYGTHHVYGVED